MLDLTPAQKEKAIKNLLGPRGFLANWPEDVVGLVDGRPVTRGDILASKRRRQERQLARKRYSPDPVIKPCFVWVFYNNGFPYGGWWLYVRTLKNDWQIDRHGTNLKLPIMKLFPCGVLPIAENFWQWAEAFAAEYHYPTRKRPDKNGLALARAVMSPEGSLLDVIPFNNEVSDESI